MYTTIQQHGTIIAITGITAPPFDFRVRLFNILALGGTVISLIFLHRFSGDVFTSGGYHGGMPAFFVFAIILYRADAGKNTGSDRFSAGDYFVKFMIRRR